MANEHCDSCDSDKIIEINAKCSDMCWIRWWPGKNGRQKEQTGYVPSVIGLGDDSDYIEMDLCVSCGQVQNYEGM